MNGSNEHPGRTGPATDRAAAHDPVPFDADGGFWLFGYGSLIQRPDVPFDARLPARLDGWERRFWQGSHDHRGTPQAPGRVVTLVEAAGAHCDGVAYRIPPAEAPAVLARLDHREKNGYARHALGLRTHAGDLVRALVYVAVPENFAWLGPAEDDALARQIAASHGPSGANRDYLLELADALEELGASDAHVAALAALVRAMD
jgi:cation transport regulator ChaC